MSSENFKANNQNFLTKSFNHSNYVTKHLIYDFECLICLHAHLQQMQIYCYEVNL
jgi:hypothetical protein